MTRLDFEDVVQDVLADRVKAVFGRFEAVDPNQLWVVDALNGPRVGDRKTYLFGFLNDHSRLVVGHRFGFAEDTVRLGAAAHSVRQRRTDPTSK